MDKELREYLKQELRDVRSHNKNSNFKDRIPVKFIDRSGILDFPVKVEMYVEPIWHILSEEDVDELYKEIDKEDKEAEYEIGRQAEIDKERQVNGFNDPSFFDFNFWWQSNK